MIIGSDKAACDQAGFWCQRGVEHHNNAQAGDQRTSRASDVLVCTQVCVFVSHCGCPQEAQTCATSSGGCSKLLTDVTGMSF